MKCTPAGCSAREGSRKCSVRLDEQYLIVFQKDACVDYADLVRVWRSLRCVQQRSSGWRSDGEVITTIDELRRIAYGHGNRSYRIGKRDAVLFADFCLIGSSLDTHRKPQASGSGEAGKEPGYSSLSAHGLSGTDSHGLNRALAVAR